MALVPGRSPSEVRGVPTSYLCSPGSAKAGTWCGGGWSTGCHQPGPLTLPRPFCPWRFVCLAPLALVDFLALTLGLLLTD